MLQKIINFIKHPTSKDIIINTIGNYTNIAFISFFVLLLVRILPPAEYGVLSVLLAIAYVLANILDLGTTATIYSYVPIMIEEKTGALYSFLKTTLFYQSFFSFIVIGLLFIFFPTLDKIFFKTNAPLWELHITAFSVLFFLWQNYIMNILFAAKKFLKANIYLNASNILKLLVILGLIYIDKVSIGSVIFVFGVVGPLFFFALVFFEKRDLLPVFIKTKIKIKNLKIKFTLTFFIASQFFNIGMRMDLFLLSFFFPNTAMIGYYGLAQKLILTVLGTITSITQVLSPGFAKIKTKKELKHQIKTSFFYLLIPVVAFIALRLTPTIIFKLVFTENFGETEIIAKSLAIPYMFYSLTFIPFLFLLYTVKKVNYILFSNIVFLILVIVGLYHFIPIEKVFAPYKVLTVGMIAVFIIQLTSSIIEYKKIDKFNEISGEKLN